MALIVTATTTTVEIEHEITLLRIEGRMADTAERTAVETRIDNLLDCLARMRRRG